MENQFREIAQLIKLPNDSNIQLKLITNLNEILEFLKKCERKKLTELQPSIEDSLFSIVNSNRANSDMCNRYIYFIYKFLFDNGHSSRLTELIIKYLQLVNNNKISHNIKATALWLLGKVCSKSMFKSPQLTDFLHNLIKIIKNTNEIFLKSESFSALSRLLMLKLPNFYNQISDILKIILKQEKYSITDIKCRKNILKALDSLIFYLNPNLISQNHEYIISFLNKNLNEEESIVQKHAIKIFVNLHSDKIFDTTINLTRIIRKKQGEQLKNFIEVILYVGNFIIAKTDVSHNLKISYINILKILFEKNKDFLNSNENLIPKIFDLLYDNFRLNYSRFESNFNINYKQNIGNLFSTNNSNNLNTSNSALIQQQNLQNLALVENQNKLNSEIEDLYRLFIKLIYHSSLRKNLLKHIFKKIIEAQSELDKMENSSLNFGGFNSHAKKSNESKDEKKDKDKSNIKNDKKNDVKKEKFNEAQVNAIIFSLIEYAENNYDIFEIVFKNFNEISQALLPYLISPVKSFRMLVNRVFINLAYFIPGWRITILTLILNFSSVAHAEVAALKNTFIYTIDESSAEFKYSLIIRNNLELLKDIANCLAIILTTFSHTHKGVTIDMSNAALSIAKNMIIGKFADEDDNPKSLSVLEKAGKFNYSNSDVDAHKEAGWIIIEGLCSMDYTWQTYNFKSLNLLWKYIFSENCCKIEEEHLSKPEYREALISEFYIKKTALSSLRKFILSSKEYKSSTNFQNTIPKHLSNIINFFIPQDQKKLIMFFKTALREKYKEAKIIFYNCLFLIQPKLYVGKFNHILHFLCEEIISSEYIEYSLDYIYANINFFDSFMCEKYSEKKYSSLSNSNNYYLINSYNIDNFDILLTEKIQTEFNAKIVNSAIALLVEILLDASFYAKNRHSILKYFLGQMSEISLKQIDHIKKNKALNITYCLFYILKKSHEKKIFIINDESLFASSKMIFDIGFKIENNLIRRISSEGHSYLIKASSNPQYNLNYYLTALECKFKNETNLDHSHFISTFYMIANIFRISEFSDILPILDNYMNFIISYFNKIEDLFNPYISQSILIITEVLIMSKINYKLMNLIFSVL